MDGIALDIGGSRVRYYRFLRSHVVASRQAWLPARGGDESDLDWGRRRVEAIVMLTLDWLTEQDCHGGVATACAGRKDDDRQSVTLSFYGSPLPDLVATVADRTDIDIGPLYDDDVCAGWGHLASGLGGLSPDSPDTILLTAGTGLAESLWVGGDFLRKGSYPRLSDLGLEQPLRADSWKDGELPLTALSDLLEARQELGAFRRIVLSGRFATQQQAIWPVQLRDDVSLTICPLDDAPALGALVCRQREREQIR